MNMFEKMQQWKGVKKLLYNVVSFLLVICFCGGLVLTVFFGTGYYEDNRIKELFAQNNTAIGQVVNYFPHERVEVEYYVDNVKYIEVARNFSADVSPGEYFNVSYDEYNPSNAEIRFDQPVLVDTEDTKTVIGTVISSQQVGFGENRSVTIEYLFRDKTIVKNRRIPFEWELKPGDKVFVQYKNSNPNICIIKLEE